MTRLTIVSLATALLLVAPGACAQSSSVPIARSTRCTRARIGTHIQCLAPGRRCRRRYEHQYKLFGFTCRRDRDGRYRLHERIFIGTPAPATG